MSNKNCLYEWYDHPYIYIYIIRPKEGIKPSLLDPRLVVVTRRDYRVFDTSGPIQYDIIILCNCCVSGDRRVAVRDVAQVRGRTAQTGTQSASGKFRLRDDLFQRYRRFHFHVGGEHSFSSTYYYYTRIYNIYIDSERRWPRMGGITNACLTLARARACFRWLIFWTTCIRASIR